MRLLLDTHALLWWFTDDARLSDRARAAIADPANTIHASAASAWEIATKQRIGKLEEVPDAAARYAELVAADGFLHLPVSYLHALRAGGWVVGHRDPFDRMLAAQSMLEGLPLVTRDSTFELFGVETLW
ncbi:MAG: type II toxin-antitoxin system VapC family toxin [Thiohalocapsa sp.]